MPWNLILSFFKSDLGKALIKWTVIIGIVVGGWFYVDGLRKSVVELEADNATLEESIKNKDIEIEGIRTDFTLIRSKVNGLQKYQNELNTDLDSLEEKFSKINADGSKRDFGALALAKPGLVEKAVNDATDEANRCLELATGAKILKNEKNSICPSIINKRTESKNNK